MNIQTVIIKKGKITPSFLNNLSGLFFLASGSKKINRDFWFTPSCAYEANPEVKSNQWNILFGVGFGLIPFIAHKRIYTSRQKDSISIVWRFNPMKQSIELAVLSYKNGKKNTDLLGFVEFNERMSSSITITSRGEALIQLYKSCVNNTRELVKETSVEIKLAPIIGYKFGPKFLNDMAPHDVKFYFEKSCLNLSLSK